MVAISTDEKAIFEVARQIKSEDARAEYLKQVCSNDKALHDRLVGQLRLYEENPEFLESPVGGVTPALDSADTVDSPPTLDTAPIAEKPGMMIGRYKLIHEIGHGGMGVVYMAVQKEPVKRKVALKIIKPGMDTKEVVARFNAERQALAMMDHQCIATVLDGGSTESGRPYFVMELVSGTPITEYCDECRFTTRQRLELFIKVCQAVQHAHLKGVIHRDIKPSNILVTTDGTVAIPKVIDFGIAKAVDQPLTDASVYTNIQQMVGTPLYMSPEQAQRTALDVDTRTDVYSLGVLLYELLTGTTPFDKQRFQESGLDEVKRIIREEEPPKPSTRLSTLGETGVALDTVAETHHTDIRTLTHELTGELDWIVMKALEKDRSRRYESASDFAKDVQRYLDDEPVEACPPSNAYRLGKFYRRNKGVLLTAVAFAAVLLVGAAVAGWQAVVAIKAKDLADERLTQVDQERMRAETNLDLAIQALDAVYIKAIGEDKLLREVTYSSDGELTQEAQQDFSELERELLQRGLAFYDQFAQQNRDNPRALLETGKAFYRVALLQTGLEKNEEAANAYAQAVARLQQLTERHPDNASYFLELGKAYYGQACLKWRPSASELFAKAEAAFDRTIELEPRNVEAFSLRGKVHTVVEAYEKAISDLNTAIRLAPENAALHDELSRLLLWSADLESRDYDGALRHAKEAVRLAPQVWGYSWAVKKLGLRRFWVAQVLFLLRGPIGLLGAQRECLVEFCP